MRTMMDNGCRRATLDLISSKLTAQVRNVTAKSTATEPVLAPARVASSFRGWEYARHASKVRKNLLKNIRVNFQCFFVDFCNLFDGVQASGGNVMMIAQQNRVDVSV